MKRWLLVAVGVAPVVVLACTRAEYPDPCEGARAALEAASVTWSRQDASALPSPDRQLAAAGYWTALRHVETHC